MECKNASATDLWSTGQLSPGMHCATPCTWCYALVRLVAVLPSPGKAQVECKGSCPLQTFSLPLFLHPLGGLLHLSGVRWTGRAKVRPLRKKKWAFLNKVDKCIWAVETDLNYMTLQFLCFGKIELPPLHSKMSRYCSIGGCCKLLRITNACLNNLCPRDLCWGSGFDTV